ncbi:MAG: hypothetical protein JW810_10445 [Sedimentisphaerales bacterium]|nr:hypothetical protein [Sedimentisphaerales bacterium]
MDQDNQRHTEPIEAPPRLVDDLQALYTPPVGVPLLVDRNILEQARRHLDRRRRRRRLVFCLRWAAVGAAAVLLVGFFVDPLGDISQPRAPSDGQDRYAYQDQSSPTLPSTAPVETEQDTTAFSFDQIAPPPDAADRRLSGTARPAADVVAAPLAGPFAKDIASAGAPAREDIDRSGRVDILDAFLLARHIDKRLALSPQWDVTGDGQVNQNDVIAVAQAAVHVRKEVL